MLRIRLTIASDLDLRQVLAALMVVFVAR